MENNHRKFGDTTGKKKNNMSGMKNLPLLEKKKKKRRGRRRMNTKSKIMIMIALMEKLLKKKIVQMRPLVKLRTLKKLLLHLQKHNWQ